MGLSIGGFDLGVSAPNFSTAGIGYWITWIAIAVVIIISGTLLSWFYLQRKTYNKKIIIFENIAGQGYQLVGKDRARTVKVGDGGEEILYLQKRKIYRTAYGRKMGKNTYWFAVGQDGYWYNILLGDLDAKMGLLDIEPIDRDMRYMHVAIRKNIQERYRKISFMEKYGQIMISAIFLLIMVVAIWLLISKVGDLISEAKPVAEALKESADVLTNAVSKLDTICGYSGIRPA